MNKLRLLFAGILVVMKAGQPVAAQSLAPSFGPTSVYAPGTVLTAVEQADGKRVVVGDYARVNGVAISCVSRFTPGGSLDAAFQQNVGLATPAFRVRVLGNGQLLMLSTGSQLTAGGVTRHSMLRLNADGTGDASFNPGTGATQGGNDIFVDDFLPLANGKIVLVGPFDRFNGTTAGRIVRLNANGTVDATFNAGQGASSEIESIVGLPNGQMLIGGYFSNYNGSICQGLARLNADGSLDNTFVSGLDSGSDVVNLALQPDGKILAAGELYTASAANGRGIARLLPNGAVDPSFTPPVTLATYSVFSYFGDALQLQPDGKVLFISSPGVVASGITRVARLNADGTLDTSFQVGPGIGPNVQPYSLTLLASGKVLVGGAFTDFGGISDRTLVQLSTAGMPETAFQPLIQSPGTAFALARQADGKLLLGGNFSEINGQPVRRLARLMPTGTVDATFAVTPGFDASVLDLALQPDGRVLALTSTSVLRFSDTGTLDNTFNSSHLAGSRFTRVLLQPDGRILVGGSTITSSGSFVAAGVMRLLDTGARDATFAPAGSGMGRVNGFQAMQLQADGKLLVAGSVVPTGSTASVRAVARLLPTGAFDASFTPSAIINSPGNAVLTTLALQADGKVLVGGQFATVAGNTRSNIARLNADGTLDAGFTPPVSTGTVQKLIIQPNNRLLLGGTFTAATLPSNLARLLPTGLSDATFAGTATPNSTVYDLLVQPDGSLMAAGAFTSLSNQPSPALARLIASNVLFARAPQPVADRTEAWPVPAHTSLTVQPDARARAQSLQLLDVLGRAVRQQTITNADPTVLKVETLPAGTYLLRVNYAEGAVLRRIQVQ